MDHIKLTHDPLDIGSISELASSNSCGAVSIFVGSTRDTFEGKKIKIFEYKAHESLAQKQLELICKELRNQWQNISTIVIYHRLGLVGFGEESVVVAVSSPNRTTSMKAVEALMDDLERRVPICRKEINVDDEFISKENEEKNVLGTDEPKNFNENVCLIENTNSIPSHLIQISVPEEEIKRRIECFVAKKRQEIDLCNIMDFTDEKGDENVENNENTMTCARVRSSVVKQEHSKGHLKVEITGKEKTIERNVSPLEQIPTSTTSANAPQGHLTPSQESPSTSTDVATTHQAYLLESSPNPSNAEMRAYQTEPPEDLKQQDDPVIKLKLKKIGGIPTSTISANAPQGHLTPSQELPSTSTDVTTTHQAYLLESSPNPSNAAMGAYQREQPEDLKQQDDPVIKLKLKKIGGMWHC